MTNRKNLLIITAACAAMTGGVSANAADNNAIQVQEAAENSRVVTAIQELSNKMEALAKAGVKSVNELAYQLDKSFTAGMILNAKQSDILNKTRAEVHADTDRAVKRTLQPFSAATLTYTSKSQPAVKKVDAETQAREQYISQLKNLEASDSIYSLVQGMEVSAYWTRKNLGNPQRNDDAFNFAAFIEPEAYTPEQLKNSQNFIGYATQQYKSYADGINLSQLRSALVSAQQQGEKALSDKINQLRNNEAYRNYQLTIRTMTANRSVATDILTSLAAERKPIITASADAELDAISRAIGVEPKTLDLQDANGQKITMFQYASPMQIAKYRANYRLNSKQWYQEVATDSAENLQRKSVVLLAEISSQLYQNHLDNEKMMGALAAMSLQSSEASSLLLKTQVNDVNAAIAGFAGMAKPANTNQITNSNTIDTSTIDTSKIDTSQINTQNVNTNTSTPAP